MTVTVAPRYKRFNGNDTTGPFSFTFPILLSNSGTPYITVKRISSSGEETTLAYSTDYTFSALLLGKGGGIITTTVMVETGEQLFVEATTPLDQQISFRNQGEFSAESHENGFDKVHFILIENVQKADLSIKFPSSEIGVATTLPVAALRANTTLGFDGSGDILCGAVATAIVSGPMISVVQGATLADARTAMGLGSAATQAASAFDAAGSAASVQSSSVQKSGSTMTGLLTLSGDPTDNLHAATKQYADAVTPEKLSTADGSAPSYSARAWCKFRGSGTVSILKSANVSSIIDNGTGDWTVNFTTAMQTSSYAVSATMGQSSAGLFSGQTISVQEPSTSGFRVKVYSDSAAAFDPENLHVIVME